MKLDIQEPMNKFFYTARTIAIVSTIGFFVGAGFALIGIEKVYSATKHWYGEFFGERELP